MTMNAWLEFDSTYMQRCIELQKYIEMAQRESIRWIQFYLKCHSIRSQIEIEIIFPKLDGEKDVQIWLLAFACGSIGFYLQFVTDLDLCARR